MRNFYQAVCGKDLKSMAALPKAKEWPPLKVVFPTLATVDASIAGRDVSFNRFLELTEQGGGTMFCGTNCKDENFPKVKPLLHDANSKRGGVLMHSKMLLALFEPIPTPLGASGSSKAEGKQKAKDSDIGGWFYVGSHNFSSAAWGTLNFKNKPPTLNVSYATRPG